MAYAEAFPLAPFWTADGLPRSWRHFAGALLYLGRSDAAETIRRHTAVMMANTDPRQRQSWLRAQTIAAGWRRMK